MERVAWALRHVTSATPAPPSRKTARDANVDRDMTAGTVQNQPRILTAVANTRRPTERDIGERIRITLSAGWSTERRAKHPRNDSLVRLAADADCRKAQERIYILPRSAVRAKSAALLDNLGEQVQHA